MIRPVRRLRQAFFLLRKRPWPLVSGLLVLLIWLTDLQVPTELSLFVFNLLPIGLVSWYASARAAYLLSGLSALLWLFSDLFIDPWFSNRALLVINMGLKVSLFIGSAYLLSKLRQALIALARRNQELAEANEMKTLFLGMASHDLRSPLSGILLTADLLQEQLQDSPPDLEDARRNVARLSEAGIRLKRMLDNYLDYARIESGGFVARRRNVDLHEWLQRILEVEEPLAANRNIRIETRYQTQGPQWCFDPDLMELALINLLSNALKFTPAGTVVTVEFETTEDGCTLRVKDQGPGMGNFASQAFDKFRRRGAKILNGEKSTGLGLYIVRKAVEAHGGQARAFDLPEGGACLEIRIPKGNAED